MVSTPSLIYKSSGLFTNPSVTVPKAPIGKTITFMFLRFFNFLARSNYLFFFSFSFNFILRSAGTAKSTILLVLFFLLIILLVLFFLLIIWSSCQDQVDRLYVKIPKEFMYLFL